MNSYYTWKGKPGKCARYLLVMKTTSKRLAELEKEVKRLHSYEVPEFHRPSGRGGSKDYSGVAGELGGAEVRNASFAQECHTYNSAWSRSAIMSSTSSMPTERRRVLR